MVEALPHVAPVVKQDVGPAQVVERQRLAAAVADPPLDGEGALQGRDPLLSLSCPAVGVAQGDQSPRLLPGIARGREEGESGREVIEGLLRLAQGLVEVPEAGAGPGLVDPVSQLAPDPQGLLVVIDGLAGLPQRAVDHGEVLAGGGLRPPLAQALIERQGLAVGGQGPVQVAAVAVGPAEVDQDPPHLALAPEGPVERQRPAIAGDGLVRPVQGQAGAGQSVEDVGLATALAHGAKAGQGLVVGRHGRGEGRPVAAQGLAAGEEPLGGDAGAVAGGGGTQRRHLDLVFSRRLQGAGGTDLQPVPAGALRDHRHRLDAAGAEAAVGGGEPAAVRTVDGHGDVDPPLVHGEVGEGARGEVQEIGVGFTPGHGGLDRGAGPGREEPRRPRPAGPRRHGRAGRLAGDGEQGAQGEPGNAMGPHASVISSLGWISICYYAGSGSSG